MRDPFGHLWTVSQADEELAKVLGTFGVAATDELSKAQASELIDRLIAEADRRAAAAAAGADPKTGEVPS